MKSWPHNLWRYIILTLVVLTTFYFLFLIQDIVWSFALGAVLAYLFHKPIKKLETKGIKRNVAISLVYLLAIAAIIILLWILIPYIINELSNLSRLLPDYYVQIKQKALQINATINIPEPLQAIIGDNFKSAQTKILNALSDFFGSFYSMLNRVFIILFAPILSFYILKEWEKIRAGFLQFISPLVKRELEMVANDIDNVVMEFVKGSLLVSAIVGILIGLAAVILGVKFAVIIGIISMVSNLIPYFGPFLGGIPAVVLALSESLRTGIFMILTIIIVQQIDSNFITPKIIGEKLGLNPLLIIFVLLAGGKIFGIWGMLIAIPLTASLKIVLHYLYLKVV